MEERSWQSGGKVQSFREKEGAGLKPGGGGSRDMRSGTGGRATETGEGTLKENRVWGGGDGDGGS